MMGKKGAGIIDRLETLERFYEDPDSEGVIPLEMLAERGAGMPEPSELDDDRLRECLWRVIEGMASIGMYLESTDHLSDRELYDYLRDDALRQPEMLFPDDPSCATILSPIGGGGEPEIWLRYYADDEDREVWMQDFPEFEMPEKEEPPFKRDHLLPGQLERVYGESH